MSRELFAEYIAVQLDGNLKVWDHAWATGTSRQAQAWRPGHFDLDPHNNSAMRPEFTFLDSRAPFMGQCTLVVKDIAFNAAF